MLFFGNKCCFFIQISIFTWMNVQNPEKSTFVAKKTIILLKTSNSDAMLLSASNIASWAHEDDSSRNQSKILRFSKNLDFWQFLKIDFEHHICCHVYRLSNITIWQHIGWGPLWQHISNKCCFPTAPQFNIHLWCRCFSGFDKINNFWQQKQQVLFLSNMTPKVLLT